jgi:pimeloyl-ACP methyl ester carboxylesterase
VAAVLALAFCSAIDATAAYAKLPLHDCRLESTDVGGTAAARCGWYRVKENRDDPNSKELQLHVAVVPALRLKPAADPLVVLSGGPGQAASDLYLSVGPAFARIRRDRDIVLIDQRGTGRSNRLDCAFPDDSDLTRFEPERLRKLVQACLAAMPGDARFYTTSIAVRDLEEVRAALGYNSLNLYGVSYGTRVAQHYLRRYPQRVRTVILDGVVPAELGLGPDVALEAQHALDNSFARCAQDERCNRAFPHISQRFRDLQTRLRQEPLTLSMADPVSADRVTATFGAAELGAAVRLLSYADETASTLPLLIHQADVADQPQMLAAQYLMIKRSTDAQIANGMHFAVVCSEDAPRWSRSDVTDAALAGTYLGTAFMTGMKAICADWPRGPVDADFGAPMQSDAPVLILSGGNDPITPQRYGERVLKGYPHGRHLVLKGQGHGQIANGCVPRLAAEFIARGSSEHLGAGCIDSIAPAAFMLSRSASAP